MDAPYQYTAYSSRGPKDAHYHGFFGIPRPSLGSDNEPCRINDECEITLWTTICSTPMLEFSTAAMAETRQGCSSCWPMVYVLLNTRAGERISAALAVGELCFSTTALQLSPLRRAFCSSNPPMFHLEDQQEE